MKIAFSTLGCPDWSWGEIVAAAKDLGYDGLEIRGIQGEFHLNSAKPFLPDRINGTKQHLQEINLSISCLTSACYLYLKKEQEAIIKDGMEYIEIASRLNVPFVRVLGDKEPQITEPVDDALVCEGLKILGDYAAQRNVTILMETNGVYADSQRISSVIERVNHPHVAVLWDVHHPYRFMNEQFTYTWQQLAPYIKYLHIKDSVQEGERIRYRLLGEGDLPLGDLAVVLKKGGYQGWASLEWVKKWHPDLEEPGIVFPQFVHAFKKIFGDSN